MITRIWHGRTKAQDADAYLQYIRETGLKEYAETPGIVSAKILRRIEGDICHFYTITEWDTIHSIKAFAGEAFEKAKYYDEDKRYLLEFEEEVKHYETFY
ncbi:antibiotic biosynthesis monooxygenase [Salmonirosea aquatica]|uniref:Antibiotic biosynthesis monooxygenase n=1 Tax=Salmonirosea aquatica TaxID=2654236 RepID=A0A7C9BGA9_9BACT|nr:antibiotic biosynthesis monooxygenase [Cytophagaceae bacterium SJW1-29]